MPTFHKVANSVTHCVTFGAAMENPDFVPCVIGDGGAGTGPRRRELQIVVLGGF